MLRFLAVLGALIFCGFAAGPASAALTDRDGDPVVIKGSAVPTMDGVAPGDVVAFRFDGGWQQVPVQVDERKVVSVGTLYPDNPTPRWVIDNNLTFDLEVYADDQTRVGADDDLNLDANDEIAFMGKDTGAKVDSGTEAAPEGVVAGQSAAVAVNDPVDGNKGYLYLFRSDGSLDPSAGKSYVDYDFKLTELGPGGNLIDDYGYANSNNPEDSTVSTAYYSLHSTDRWNEDGMEISAGDADGTDILDREVAQASLNGCGRSEVTFSGNWSAADRDSDSDEGTYVAVTNGPVRAIRSYMGANSGPYVQRDHVYYEQREDNNIYLRVHPMYDLYSWTDYAPSAAGMTYRNFKNPVGVPVDGVPDTLVGATSADFQPGMVAWEQLSGDQGTVSTLTSVDTTIDPPHFKSYYLDDSTPVGANETQCGGDQKSFGASGFGIGEPDDDGGFHTPNTDPRFSAAFGQAKDLTVHRIRYFGDPDTDGADAAKLADRVKEPLTATAADFTPLVVGSGKAKLKLKLPSKTLKVKAGKKARFKVRISNIGDAAARSVVLCVKGGRQKVPHTCSTSSASTLGAGKSQTRKMNLRVKRSAKKGTLLKVRISVWAKGSKTVAGTVRIKVK